MSEWYLAPSLKKCFTDVNSEWPLRSRASDGSVGDTAHQTRKSDHNPDPKTGVVRAIDITLTGDDAYTLIAMLINDDRTEYVIHDGKIWSRVRDFKAIKYTGPNPHKHHIHLSIRHTKAAENDISTWIKHSAPEALDRPTLREGSRGWAVKDLQTRLNIKVDGDFGPKTEAAVRAYQKSHKLTVDGVVGPQTWSHLYGRPVK